MPGLNLLNMWNAKKLVQTVIATRKVLLPRTWAQVLTFMYAIIVEKKNPLHIYAVRASSLVQIQTRQTNFQRFFLPLKNLKLSGGPWKRWGRRKTRDNGRKIRKRENSPPLPFYRGWKGGRERKKTPEKKNVIVLERKVGTNWVVAVASWLFLERQMRSYWFFCFNFLRSNIIFSFDLDGRGSARHTAGTGGWQMYSMKTQKTRKMLLGGISLRMERSWKIPKRTWKMEKPVFTLLQQAYFSRSNKTF